MAANSSIILSNIDFDTHKNTLKQYLKSQDTFKDYDFDGANINVLLDILSYNTFHNMFYLNMAASEMFMDTAQLRDSVVSHAKELNYTPRSFKSAEADVAISLKSSDTNLRSAIIPKGSTFTSRLINRNYTFTTNENIVLTDYTVGIDSVVFTGNMTLYEGYYVTDTYTYNSSEPGRFIISNPTVDLSSLTVTVIEDVGKNTYNYNRATSLFNIDSTSQVYFVSGCENNLYEIMFGDGITGRKPKDNSVITVQYRVCNGQLPNGCNTFNPDSTFSGATATITTITPASGGSVSESIDEIKYNAPRHFATQERAITTNDYENLLKLNFNEINAVSAYGGENLDPPQYGKVFVAVDLKDVDGVPTVKRDQYYRFLKQRSPVSIDPVFVNPDYTYIGVNSTVKYNINTSKLSSEDIRTLVTSSILNYAQTNLNSFNKVFRYSNMVEAIDATQAAIISNETNVKVIKIITPTLNEPNTIDVKFDIPLDRTRSVAKGGYSIQSTRFTYNNQKATLQDDGLGVINIVSTNDSVITNVGTVDYDTGLVQLSKFVISDYEGSGIKIKAEPASKEFSVQNNVILNIVVEDISLKIQGVS